MSKKLKVAVAGVTGMVGREMLRVLEQRDFPVGELVPVASARSAGKKVPFRGEEHTVREIAPEVFEGVDVALFSAGSGPSKEWSPIAAEKGAVVIDNSSAFRKDPECPLVVPEVNMAAAKDRPKGIIANPNCSTIQMVVALKPIHDAAKITRVVVATYQAISGSGAGAVSAFETQMKQLAAGETVGELETLKGQLAGNVLMHWSRDVESGYQEEELKMVHETRKIFGDDSIRVSPTAVRVPVVNGHAESLAIETEKPITPDEARALLEKAAGVKVVDDFANGVYPTPIEATGTDPVYVGRIREDVGNPGGLQMFVVADNLRKGAALNAVQIAEGLFL
ncbi:MAG TPA: aspartate-semialdehyde dehydrogenase [Polyangiaceae bacterium LLY-WYZ-15_(1-7)]|nr:aspartate-semialdehyde dehydrogenase [Myxococcales bacterium]MAT24655.1 aspartate-semialdehyde dehydrogenase [Sandaracinus sp.]HJK89710.1 aspartate-semialdehyde dehydrogenase [Polyangiaceae bacterium LLY-WYZ-15_(1-7)]MBJ72556.1 aspartate-semialdehyde dehydrogenase [Sandaracinus sp.]HJL06371.1 aspartate-semialdehyde dehydrogenase [Polyangiaceae bacterium LLY-WYZ-15_(1-7)]